MNGRRAGAGTALGATAAVLLAGCGVPTTGVVDVGEPANGLATAPAARSEAVAFFLDGERLQAAGLNVSGGSDPVTAAVDLLFAGPAAVGRPDLTTQLPQPPVTADVRTKGRTVTVRLPAGVRRLDPLAMRQLACTVVVAFPSAESVPAWPPPSGEAAPEPTTAPVQVEVTTPGWHLEQTAPTCPPPSLPSAISTRPPS
ncbi:hypothetical protein [Streptomyces sp. NBC_00448]|uniref:hypothetical protein n=1 Tax=Streptomyces sp. NBC_00448 TaxID=2903652 RepID=UPI002E1FDC05